MGDASGSPARTLGAELAQLAALHADGVLSDQEFHAAKARALGDEGAPTNDPASSSRRLFAGVFVGVLVAATAIAGLTVALQRPSEDSEPPPTSASTTATTARVLATTTMDAAPLLNAYVSEVVTETCGTMPILTQSTPISIFNGQAASYLFCRSGASEVASGPGGIAELTRRIELSKTAQIRGLCVGRTTHVEITVLYGGNTTTTEHQCD